MTNGNIGSLSQSDFRCTATSVSERVFERSVIDDVSFCSELDCFRASIPSPADIGDRDTFLRRSLQLMAIDVSGLHALSEKPMFLAFHHLALKCRLCFRLKRLLAWRHRILQQLMFLRG